MPEEIILIPISTIQILDRYRKEIDVESVAVLAEDIKANGLLNPIIVDDKMRLVCGERRLRAFVHNEETSIPARIFNDLTEYKRRKLEISENIKRHNFLWWEEIYAVKDVHRAAIEEHGSAHYRRDGKGWRLEDSATELGISKSTVAHYLDVAGYLDTYPEAIEQPTLASALKYIREQEERKITAELSRRHSLSTAVSQAVGEDGDSAEQPLKPLFVNEDCTKWLPVTITEPVAHLIFIDPPYGIGADKLTTVARSHTEHYDDTPGLGWELNTKEILQVCYDAALDGAHCYLFFGMVLRLTNQAPRSLHGVLVNMLSEGPWNFDPLPLIWPKGESGSAGRAFEKSFIPGYEPIFHLWKGECRPFNEGYRHNLNLFPSIKGVSGKNKIHPAHKPMELYEQLCNYSGVAGGVAIDPCAGSGESGVACIRKGITPILIEKGPIEFAKMVVYVTGRLGNGSE